MRLFSGTIEKEPRRAYDPAALKPVIRANICTGEKTAGFRDLKTGKIREVMVIRSAADLEAFRREYGITEEIETVY